MRWGKCAGETFPSHMHATASRYTKNIRKLLPRSQSSTHLGIDFDLFGLTLILGMGRGVSGDGEKRSASA